MEHRDACRTRTGTSMINSAVDFSASSEVTQGKWPLPEKACAACVHLPCLIMWTGHDGCSFSLLCVERSWARSDSALL